MLQIQTAISFLDLSYSSEREKTMDSALLAMSGVGIFNKILQTLNCCIIKCKCWSKLSNFQTWFITFKIMYFLEKNYVLNNALRPHE